MAKKELKGIKSSQKIKECKTSIKSDLPGPTIKMNNDEGDKVHQVPNVNNDCDENDRSEGALSARSKTIIWTKIWAI